MEKQRAKPVPWALRCVVAESPRWHAGCWWWVDATAGTVFRYRPRAVVLPSGSRSAEPPWLSMRRRVAVVHPASPAGMLVASGMSLAIYGSSDHGGNQLATLARLALPDGWVLNDGVGAIGGGAWIGVVAPDHGPAGYLQRIHADGTLGAAVTGIAMSNGLAYGPQAEVLYHADSTARKILVHRLNSEGDILDTRVHLGFEQGLPDGIATDRAGYLWVAMYGLGEVRRYDRAGGLNAVISVPAPQVTAVALGGADGRDVLITTAREGYGAARSAAEPMAGRLFAARSPDAAGDPIPCAYRVALSGVSGPVERSLQPTDATTGGAQP